MSVRTVVKRNTRVEYQSAWSIKKRMNKKGRRLTSANYMVDNLHSVGKDLSQREVKCILMVRKVVKREGVVVRL